MEIKYNVTGEKRRALVGAISQELNAPVKYLGAPTFAYEVGGYLIGKNGELTGPDNLGLEVDLQGIHGFVAIEREYDEPDTYESGLGGMGATPSIKELKDEAEIWAERELRRQKLESANVPDYSNRGQYGGDDVPTLEELQMTEGEELGLGKDRREDFQGENGMRASDVPESHEACSLTIELPLAGFTEAALENLDRLIASKAALIKKAIGADALPVERTVTTLKFPWFSFSAAGDEVAAYSHFIGALCAAAKEQKRVTATEKPVQNEKYAFRVFLMRLGFVGEEYKAARKILLENLSGNSAYKNGVPLQPGQSASPENEVSDGE